MNVLDILLSAATEVFQKSVTPADNLFDIGGDSLTIVEWATVLEDRLGMTLDIDELFEAENFMTLSKQLSQRLGQD